MRRRAPARPVLLALVVAVSVAIAGCSSKDKGSSDAAEIVRDAPEKTVDAGSSRVALNINFTTAGTDTTVRGEGLFDLRTRRGGLSLDLGAMGAAIGGGTVETVVDSGGVYVKLPSAGASGKPWFKVDLATVGQQAGLGSLAQLQQTDPTQALQYLKGATDDVRDVGEQQLRGADTTHYRATIDLRRARDSFPPESQKALDELIANLGTSKLPADLWIDDHGRLRKMAFSVDPDGSGPSPPGTVELELFDFGVPVDVQVPPADQVTDLTRAFTPPSSAPR